MVELGLYLPLLIDCASMIRASRGVAQPGSAPEWGSGCIPYTNPQLALPQWPINLVEKADTLKSDTPQSLTSPAVKTPIAQESHIPLSSPISRQTFRRFAYPEVVVTSLMPVQRRFHHEDRAGAP